MRKWTRKYIGSDSWTGETPLYLYRSNDGIEIRHHITSEVKVRGGHPCRQDYWTLSYNPAGHLYDSMLADIVERAASANSFPNRKAALIALAEAEYQNKAISDK